METRALRSPLVLCAVLLWLGVGVRIDPAFAQNNAAPQKSADANTASANGAEVYMQARCFACHGQNGLGTVGPRFREDRFLALTDYVVGQILLGRDIMPAFANTLNDQQIAAVATYIRNSWGNDFGQVQPQDVAMIRSEVKQNPPQAEAGTPSTTGSGAPGAPPAPPPQSGPH